MESFTQSFSYINATQRDCPPHGQFSRAVSSAAEGGGKGRGEVKGVEARALSGPGETNRWDGDGDRGREGRMTGCEGYCVSPRGTQCLSSSNIADASLASLCHRVSLPC